MSEADSALESGKKRIPEDDGNIDDYNENEADVDMSDLDVIDGLLAGESLENLGEQGGRGNNNPEEILLSSDEEPDTTADVSLVLLKRPPAMEPQEAFAILDSDEEFPVVIAEANKPQNVNIVEKKGRVAEYIEKDGLGMLYAE